MNISDYNKKQIIAILELLDIDFDKSQSKAALFNLLLENEEKFDAIRSGKLKPLEVREPSIDFNFLTNYLNSHQKNASAGLFYKDLVNAECTVNIHNLLEVTLKDGSSFRMTPPYDLYFIYRPLSVDGDVINLSVKDLHPDLQFQWFDYTVTGYVKANHNACSSALVVSLNTSHNITDIRLSGVPVSATYNLSTNELSVNNSNLGSVYLSRIEGRDNTYGCYIFPHKVQSYYKFEVFDGINKYVRTLKINEFKPTISYSIKLGDDFFDAAPESALQYDVDPSLIRCPVSKIECPEVGEENSDEGGTFDDEIDLDDKFCGRLNPTYPRNRIKEIDTLITRGESFVGADTVRRRDGSWEVCPPCDIQTYTEQKYDDDGSFLQRTNYASVDDDGNYDWFECHPKPCFEATDKEYNIPDTVKEEIENKRNLIDELIAIRSKGTPKAKSLPFDDELARRRGGRITEGSFEAALAKRQSKHRL